jgi:hypothetical protein
LKDHRVEAGGVWRALEARVILFVRRDPKLKLGENEKIWNFREKRKSGRGKRRWIQLT